VKNNKNDNNWFIDKDSKDRWIYHRIMNHIVSARTKFQQVEIIDTYLFGRMVVIDNKIQSAEADEFIYHEILVHPVMIAHPEPRNVLILGAGEGATLREVLKHPTVHKAIMIDIDKEFVLLCKKHLRKWHKGSFHDRRAELIYGDAFEYLKNQQDRFDVIIADISDPDEKGPAVSIYTKGFYSLIKKALRPDGIFVTHSTAIYHIPYENISAGIFKTLKKIFPEVSLYYEYIPSFGTLWSFSTGSLKYRPETLSSYTIRKRLKERGIENLSYYEPEIHKKLFIIPECIKKLLSRKSPSLAKRGRGRFYG
jgi:spermidine synthase